MRRGQNPPHCNLPSEGCGVQVPLDGFPSFQRIECNTQLCVIRRVAEGAFNAIIITGRR